MIQSSLALVDIDDVVSYQEIVAAEQANLQKGMNFQTRQGYSVFLMSVRRGAPYQDHFDEVTRRLVYEGHDAPRSEQNPIPKIVDQPKFTSGGKLTDNGRFFEAAQAYKNGLNEKPEMVKVYEKIKKGIWSYKGFFNLEDAVIAKSEGRNVFKFYLSPAHPIAIRKSRRVSNQRIIPTQVKLEVWTRDKGKCVKCGSSKNLHFDHILPFSKGGTSETAENVQLLCAKHNLEKSNRIE